MKRSELASFWRRRFEAFEQSGLTIQDYCAAEGVSRTTFFKWRQRLSERSEPKVEFVEVGASREQQGLELVLKSGMVVRLGSDFDRATLERLLEFLDGR